MNNTPKISIIVPCYNQVQYLNECLQSVFDQTYQNWECIIVNDGSPESPEEITREWMNIDSRFKYLEKENGGLSSARNAGIEIAEGEWILPLDADDKIGNLYLELAQKEFSKDYTIIYCEAEFFGNKTGKWELPDFNYRELATNNIIFCSAFFKKNDWSNNNGYDVKMLHGLEDWEFWISLLKEGKKVYKINSTCFFYRIKHESMITNLHNDKKRKMLYYLETKHLDFFHEQLGSIHELNENYRLIKKSNKELLLKLESKRYKYIDKLLSIISK